MVLYGAWRDLVGRMDAAIDDQWSEPVRFIPWMAGEYDDGEPDLSRPVITTYGVLCLDKETVTGGGPEERTGKTFGSRMAVAPVRVSVAGTAAAAAFRSARMRALTRNTRARRRTVRDRMIAPTRRGVDIHLNRLEGWPRPRLSGVHPPATVGGVTRFGGTACPTATTTARRGHSRRTDTLHHEATDDDDRDEIAGLISSPPARWLSTEFGPRRRCPSDGGPAAHPGDRRRVELALDIIERQIINAPVQDPLSGARCGAIRDAFDLKASSKRGISEGGSRYGPAAYPACRHDRRPRSAWCFRRSSGDALSSPRAPMASAPPS